MNMETNQVRQNPLDSVIQSFDSIKILVIGDIMLDRFVYGHVERISPESPVPVLSVAREDMMLGGAGNALANLIGLKVKSDIIGLIGDDEPAKDLQNVVRALGVSTDHLICDETRQTILKTRFLAGHQQLLRTDYESKGALSDTVKAQVLEKAKMLIKDADALILSDYGKGLLRPDLLKDIIALAHAHGVPVIADPKGQDFSIYEGVTAITPNKKELSEATKGHPVESDEDVVDAAQILIDDHNINAVIATRSKDGITVVQKDGMIHHVRSTKRVEVFDVSGAGDTVIATLAAALAAKADFKHAAELANLAGSIAVSKVGTAPIRYEELQNAVSSNDFLTSKSVFSAPVVDAAELAEHVKRWKARGLKVGFTNGCFDILHVGHVNYLAQARLQCDRLIVGLNHDKSVRILKGPDRPVHDQNSRAGVLGALASVDIISFFGASEAGGDNTANDLLKQIKPDLYFKGGDYKVDDVPEAPIVKAYGGEVRILDVTDGQSTTQSIRKIKNEAA